MPVASRGELAQNARARERGDTRPLAHAQRSDTLRIVVPFTPGTTPDTLARALTPQLQARLGLNPVTDNKPGASGMIGMSRSPRPPT
jgi:tripartite-type tricarboxylate transporter receptor subunit TctC